MPSRRVSSERPCRRQRRPAATPVAPARRSRASSTTDAYRRSRIPGDGATAAPPRADAAPAPSPPSVSGSFMMDLQQFGVRASRETAAPPVTISAAMTPSAKTSLRASISPAVSCSGAMYPTVPITTPGLVSAPLPAPSSAAIFARPKSSTFTTSSPAADCVTSTFSGLRSRCTTPCRCAAATAAQICSNHFAAIGPGSRPCRSSSARNVRPRISSITSTRLPHRRHRSRIR